MLAYTGTRPSIKAQDVMAVVNRDKKDPIFSLTNALMDRDGSKALIMLSSLFSEGFHPLQILKSLENQVRKLLVVKSFTTGLYQGDPGLPQVKSMHFNGFKQVLLPRIVARDKAVTKSCEEQERMTQIEDLTPQNNQKDNQKKRQKKKKAKPVVNDLVLAPNPKNPYPVFQNFQKSENFSLDELTSALMDLSDLDYALKSSGIEAKIGIENFIMALCRRGGSIESKKN